MRKNIILAAITSIEIHMIVLLLMYEKIDVFIPKNQNTISVYFEKNNNKNSAVIDINKKIKENKEIIDGNLNKTVKKQEVIQPEDNEFPRYSRIHDLDYGPRPVGEIVVPSPKIEMGKHEGFVIIEIFIDSHGFVKKIDVKESNVPDDYIKSAITTFENSKFIPGIKNGVNKSSVMKVEVKFYE